MGLKIYKSFSEETLLQGCRQRDEKAQRALYEKFSPIMYPLCLRYVKEVDEAEDVMITGFMRAFEKIDSYSGTGSLGAWLRKIMINQALGHLRKNKTMYLEVDVETAEHQMDFSCSADQLEAEDLLKMIRNLPLGYRTVFNLFAIEGYSHKEISKLLGISENTSKSQLNRARKLLQKALIREHRALNTKIENNE